MKPVVSSIVALVIAIAPFTAMASPDKPAHKPAAAKVVKHPHAKKVAKTHKADASDKADAAPIAHVRHVAKDADKDAKKAALKPVLHHATGVDMGGAGHKEPKVDGAASAHGKIARVSHQLKVDARPEALPKLPNPNAQKAQKGGAEKAGKKGSENKNADGSDDGELRRDEEMADLVAPIIQGTPPHKAGAPAKADPSPHGKTDKKAKPASAAACSRPPIEIIRGPETDTFELTRCDGTLAPLAIEHLSVSVRPGSAARPTAPFAELAKRQGDELAKGIRRVDERLALRLQAVADRFAKAGTPVKLSVVSGYRPTSVGSMHASGRAVDFRLEGVANEEVVAFCKTLTDTGCGYYPNSSFVHLDVRDAGKGHVSWIDASGPGEAPRYVPTWPPPRASDTLEAASARQSADPADSDSDSDEEGKAAADAHPSAEAR
jgi:hypothetical protein